MLAFRHIASGTVAITGDPEGYGAPDWEALPDPPAAPCEWDAVAEAWIVDLAPMKRALVDAVNDRAEAIRGLYLTPGTGQAMTYLKKEMEARAWVVGADPADFPWIKREAELTNASFEDTVALVLAQANAWEPLGQEIEAYRRGLIVAIEAAQNIETLDQLDVSAGWPGQAETQS